MLLEFGIPDVARENLAGAEGPVLRKDALQLPHHGAVHAEMHVEARMARIGGEHVSRPDVHAAGETDVAVHDHDLPVVAQVHAQQPEEKMLVHEGVRRDAVLMQHAHDAGPRVARAHVIHDDPHLHATLHGALQFLDELRADPMRLEDEGAQRHAAPRRLDRRDHGQHRLLAVHGSDVVSDGESEAEEASEANAEAMHLAQLRHDRPGIHGACFGCRRPLSDPWWRGTSFRCARCG